MKRIIALALAALTIVTLFVGCGTKDEEDLPAAAQTTRSTTGATISLDETPQAPLGYVRFATLDTLGNVVVDDALTWLLTAVGESVLVDKNTTLTANATGGVVTSVSDIPGNSFAVVVQEEYGVTVIYGHPGTSADDPSVIDLTGNTDPNQVPPKTAGFSTTTTKKSTTTTKKSTAVAKPSAISTVPKVTLSAEQQAILDEKEKINTSTMSATEKKAALSLLNYKMDQNGIFYVDHQPWQKQFGFNQIYDLASPLIQLVYATVRVKFRYGYVYALYPKGDAKQGQVIYDASGNPTYEKDAQGNPIPKDWMVQLWKGRYGLVMLGGEMGVYTKPSTQTSEHYYSAVAEEELIMAMDVYQHDFVKGTTKKLFTRGPESAWWLTGFVPGSYLQYNKKSEIILVGNLEFPNAEMLEAFRVPFEAAGFHPGSPGRDNPETYTTSGTSLKFSWQYIDQDDAGAN
ncbi:MAG: DUF4474 domain-containing protein [Oscillospiraceae bacterium]|jgi:hypothetical protein|nr:DUF4474 domain-containing protein [Oscillospiraceae bacterium]